MKRLLVLLFLFQTAFAKTPLLSIGGGYYEAGLRHSGGIGQIEYTSGRTFFNYIRPKFALLVPEGKALFLGGGICLELYLSRHLVICPSFMPGYYYQGKGRDLGFPLEFRSCFEISYELERVRVGAQIHHISNASLSHRNPGSNSYVIVMGIPFKALECYGL